MKKSLVILGITFIIIGVLFSYQEDLQKIYYQVLRRFTQGELVLKKNQYYRDYDFDFVQNTDKLEPTNRQELLNTFYTIINSGEEEFTFYCPDSYSSCLDEVEQIANDQDLLSHINNFVHPYNGFNHIETQYDSLGKVTVYIKKSYSKKQIQELESKIDELSQELILPGDSDINNIRRVHDYIINHSIYDSNRSDYNITTYNSDIAYGPLFQGYGICGGYTDAMELFLEEMGIKSYKISSDQHVWNAVYLDGKWVHLDLTWDDPVVSSGENLLEHNFFLIDTSTLLALEHTEHIVDQNIYSELKEVLF